MDFYCENESMVYTFLAKHFSELGIFNDQPRNSLIKNCRTIINWKAAEKLNRCSKFNLQYGADV